MNCLLLAFIVNIVITSIGIVIFSVGCSTDYSFEHRIFKFLPPAYVVRREGNSFTLLVFSQGGVNPAGGGEGGGGVGQSSWGGASPARGGGQFSWGGVSPARGGISPIGGAQSSWGGSGQSSWGGGGQLGGVRSVSQGGGQLGGGLGVGQDRTTERVLTTRRVVCLLRSRRRTFLLK